MGDWSQAGQGAAGGAMTGAAIGSVIPGVGTAIGAGAGALLGGAAGLFGDDNDKQKYANQLAQLSTSYANRQGPQAGPASQSAYSNFRGNQQGLISMLESLSRGTGPSAASMQMREAMDRAAGAQASAAAGAGGRGVNAGAAYRNASNNTAAIQAQNARDTGLMRVQEQLGATSQLGQAVGNARGQDEGNNQFNASQSNQMEQANLQAKLQTLGINTQAQLNALIAAMGGSSPGLGTQLLAGGASAMPSYLQYAHSQGMGNVQQPGGSLGKGQSVYPGGY